MHTVSFFLMAVSLDFAVLQALTPVMSPMTSDQQEQFEGDVAQVCVLLAKAFMVVVQVSISALSAADWEKLQAVTMLLWHPVRFFTNSRPFIPLVALKTP